MAGRVFKRGKTYWLGCSYHGKEHRRSCKVELQYLSQALRLAQRKKLLKEIPHIPRFKCNNAR